MNSQPQIKDMHYLGCGVGVQSSNCDPTVLPPERPPLGATNKEAEGLEHKDPRASVKTEDTMCHN